MASRAAARFPDNLLLFTRVVRRAGIDVPVGRLLDLYEALLHVDVARRDEVFHACRTVLVSRHDQLVPFAALFDAFWRDHDNPFGGAGTVRVRDERTAAAREAVASMLVDASRDSAQAEGVEDALIERQRTWSDTGGLADKDFGEFTADELALARAALDQLEWIAGERRTRRWVAGPGPRLDIRRAIARSLRTGGDVVAIPTRRRRIRLRPLVLLCDVSGSMERYSKMLLQFAHGLGRRHGRVEAFLFSTGLTRVTRQLRARRIADAAAAVSTAVPDWSGGTRIGPALQEFHRRWARRVMHESPVVLLISDGWDRGDPVLLREQVARLQRSCHRLIWLNPLIGTLDYAPLTRGLQAAMPFVDDFLPVRTLTDLAELAVHLRTVAGGSSIRRRSRPLIHGRHRNLHV